MLRQLYYLEREYFNKYGRYADSFKKLGVNKAVFDELPGIPKIETTKSLYEIMIPGFNKGVTWHIDYEGKTWSSK